MQSSDEWPAEEYHSSTPELAFDELFDDANYSNNNMVAAATLTGDTESPKVSPSSSSGATGLFPKGNVGKPIRRRSRASKKAPTTLLNASPKNFRALVQQFTGCHSAPPSLGAYKGPINLNFAQYSHYSGKSEVQQRQQPPPPESHQNTQHHEGPSDQGFFSFGTAAADDHDELLGRADPLTSTDDFHMEWQEQSGQPAGDYSTLPGTTNNEGNELWRY